MNEIEKLKIEIEKIEDEINKLYNKNLSESNFFYQYEILSEKFLNKISELNLKIPKETINHHTFNKKEDFGSVIDMGEFVECCKCGGFIDYDGFGRYMDGDEVYDIEIIPSQVIKNKHRKDFNKVIWYNK